MIKDRDIKRQALQYAATRLWYPHMEVEVASTSRVGRRVSLVTDIDVLAIAPDPVLGVQTILFDCKTKASESAPNRSLWLAGLMKQFSAEQAFCVLKKASIDPDHRHVAQELGVVLIPEDEFPVFGKVTAGKELFDKAAVAQVDTWERLAGLKTRFPHLAALLEYRAGPFWHSRFAQSGCRRVVAMVLEHRAEFDPAHLEHECLFGDFVSLFALTLSSLVASIFRSMLVPASATDFEEIIRVKLYGGRDEYEQQNRLFKLLKQTKHGDSFSDDLAPPEWPRFTKLLRQLLDDPNAVLGAALIIKEISFALMGGDSSYLSGLVKRNSQHLRFAVLMADYFSRATKVPPEFGERLQARLIDFG